MDKLTTEIAESFKLTLDAALTHPIESSKAAQIAAVRFAASCVAANLGLHDSSFNDYQFAEACGFRIDGAGNWQVLA